MHRRRQLMPALYLVLMSLVSGCASTDEVRGDVIPTHNETSGRGPFSNVLVIGVAGSFDDRAQFEQEMVNALTGDNAMVTAYFAVLGRRPQLSRAALDTSVRSRIFDAVILTREVGQDKPEFAPRRPTGRSFDLFLYDYAELNTPYDLNTDSTMTFVTEIYDTSDKSKIWSIDTLVYAGPSRQAAVSGHVNMIVDEIRGRSLIRR